MLSVIIPAYNAERYIDRCLRSIDSQGIPGVDVTVVDDGSVHDLASHLDLRSYRIPIHIVRQVQSGVSAARNLGFRASEGDWLMFVDADDWLPPDSLGPFASAAVQHGSDICIADFIQWRHGNETVCVNVNSKREFFDADSMNTFQWLSLASIGFGGRKNVGLVGAPWAKIYSREFLTRAFPSGDLFRVGVRRGQDVLFNVEAFGLATRVSYHRAPSYVYAISDSSSSHKPNDSFLSDVEVLASALRDVIEKFGSEDLNPALDRLIVTLFDEAVSRSGEGALGARAAEAARIAKIEPFSTAIRESRFKDHSARGKIKVLLLRWRLYLAYVAALKYGGRRT